MAEAVRMLKYNSKKRLYQSKLNYIKKYLGRRDRIFQIWAVLPYFKSFCTIPKVHQISGTQANDEEVMRKGILSKIEM